MENSDCFILFFCSHGGLCAAASANNNFSTNRRADSYINSGCLDGGATNERRQTDKNHLRNTAVAATAGKPLFEANCAPCHGDTGKGDGPIAASLTPKPENLTAGDVLTDPDGELFLAVRMGKKDNTGKVTMAPVTKLSDQQIWQIVAYVRTLAKK